VTAEDTLMAGAVLGFIRPEDGNAIRLPGEMTGGSRPIIPRPTTMNLKSAAMLRPLK